MNLTQEQLQNGVSLPRLKDQVRERERKAREWAGRAEIERLAQEGFELMDAEANGNRSILKRRFDNRARIMDEANRNEAKALKFALSLAVKYTARSTP